MREFIRQARLRAGLWLAKAAARIADVDPPRETNPGVGSPPPGVGIGPEARAMIQAGMQPRARYRPPKAPPLKGSAQDLLERAEATGRVIGR